MPSPEPLLTYVKVACFGKPSCVPSRLACQAVLRAKPSCVPSRLACNELPGIEQPGKKSTLTAEMP
jgi:hypothetical protein